MKLGLIFLVATVGCAATLTTPISRTSSSNPVEHPTGAIVHVVCYKTLTIDPCVKQAAEVCPMGWTPKLLPGDTFAMAEPFTDWDTQSRGWSMLIQCNQ